MTRHYEMYHDEPNGGQSLPMVPRTCMECGRPAFYDNADDQYHHAANRHIGCFLIPSEHESDDDAHPLMRRPGVGADR